MLKKIILCLLLVAALPGQLVPLKARAEEMSETQWEEDAEAEETHFFPDYTVENYADVLYGSGTIKKMGAASAAWPRWPRT